MNEEFIKLVAVIQSKFSAGLSSAVYYDVESDNRAEEETPSGEISLRAITPANEYTFSRHVHKCSIASVLSFARFYPQLLAPVSTFLLRFTSNNICRVKVTTFFNLFNDT